jgi:hypothetical protein
LTALAGQASRSSRRPSVRRPRFRQSPGWQPLALALAQAGFAAMSARDARAGEAPDAAPQPAHQGYVSLRVAAPAEDSAALEATLRELMSRLRLSLRETSIQAASPSAFMAAPQVDADERARVSVDETASDHVVVSVEAVQPGQALSPVERTVPRGTSNAILTEQVAHVIHSTLESLLAGEEPPAPPPSRKQESAPQGTGNPAEAQVAPRRESFGLDATAFAAGRGVASNTGPTLGGGGAVSVTPWTGPWKPSLSLGGAYFAPFGTPATDVTLQTTITSFRAVASVRVPRTRVIGLDAGLGAGADLFHTVPSTTGNPATVTLGKTQDLADPVVTARVVAGIRLSAGARIVVGIDVDFDAGARRYVTEAIATKDHDTVMQPWLVRPSAMVGLCIPLIGSIGCAGPE